MANLQKKHFFLLLNRTMNGFDDGKAKMWM